MRAAHALRVACVAVSMLVSGAIASFCGEIDERYRDCCNAVVAVSASTALLFGENIRSKCSKVVNLEDAAAGMPFGFLPVYSGATIPAPAREQGNSTSRVSFPSTCFEEVTVTSQWTTDINMNIEIVAGAVRSGIPASGCQDAVQLWSSGLGFKFYTLPAPNTTSGASPTISTSWAMSKMGQPLRPDQQWFVRTQGLYVFRFPRSVDEMLLDALATVALLVGFNEAPLSNATIAANIDFTHQFVQASTERMGPRMQPRSGGTTVARSLRPGIDVLPGDALVVHRLDGLDPTLAWAMGFTAAHTAVVLHNNTLDELVVCEANVKSAFWPTDGVQCAAWGQWIEQAEEAQLNVALAPLKLPFNNSAALAFVESSLGVQYGFPTLIYPWLDTVNANYPCLPFADPATGQQVCESAELEALKAIELDEQLGNVTTNPYRQALSNRLSTLIGNPSGSPDPQSLTVGQVLQTAQSTFNVSFAQLAAMPELDSYRYMLDWPGREGGSASPSLGPSLVCSVFVCHAWKQAGVFGDTVFNCGELSPWGLFSAAVLDPLRMFALRPGICTSTDPTGALCQLTGAWSMATPGPDLGARSLFDEMDSTCPTIWPEYVRPLGC
jgi:hypothetical protein